MYMTRRLFRADQRVALLKVRDLAAFSLREPPAAIGLRAPGTEAFGWQFGFSFEVVVFWFTRGRAADFKISA